MDLSENRKKIYEFGEFRLDEGQRLLLQNGEPVKLPAKSFELLLYFVKNRNEVIERERLMRAVWNEAFVEDSNLTVHISGLRRILSAGDADARIETFPKIGYRFAGEVVEQRNGIDRPADDADRIFQATSDRNGPDAGADALINEKHQNGSPASSARLLFFGVSVLIIVGVIGFVAYKLLVPNGEDWYSNVGVTRLTNTGSSTYGAISPDGQYVVYDRTKGNGRSFSLWLRAVGTMSETEIVPQTEGAFAILTFLPDGKHIAYGYRDASKRINIYVMPLFGGGLRRLPIETAADISFSPDGGSMAYIVRSPDGSSTVFVSDSDGSNPRAVAVRRMPDTYNFSYRPAWSPDGKRLACLGQNGSENGPRLFEIDLESGGESVITKETWTWITEFAWLPDGSGLLMVAASPTSSLLQIWRVSYPDGALRQITNDTSSYFSLSLSKDGNSLVSSQRRVPNVVWTVPASGASPGDPPDSVRLDWERASRISYGNVDGVSFANAYASLAWTPDGNIVFTSEDAGNIDVWSMRSDGSARKQLTTDPHSDTGPSVSSDGRHIVFMSRRTGAESLWLMDISGADQRHFFNMSIERQPVFSPDGRWIYFTSMRNGVPSIWRKPVDGGEAAEVVPGPTTAPKISPDGKMLLFRGSKGFVVVPADGGAPLYDFPGPGRRPEWLPSGRGFTFLDYANDVENVWYQDLAGSERRRLTNFESDDVMVQGWSLDGKSLAVARGTQASDVAMIRNLK